MYKTVASLFSAVILFTAFLCLNASATEEYGIHFTNGEAVYNINGDVISQYDPELSFIVELEEGDRVTNIFIDEVQIYEYAGYEMDGEKYKITHFRDFGYEYEGGETVTLFVETENLKRYSADISLIDSSPALIGNIITNGESGVTATTRIEIETDVDITGAITAESFENPDVFVSTVFDEEIYGKFIITLDGDKVTEGDLEIEINPGYYVIDLNDFELQPLSEITVRVYQGQVEQGGQEQGGQEQGGQEQGGQEQGGQEQGGQEQGEQEQGGQEQGGQEQGGQEQGDPEPEPQQNNPEPETPVIVIPEDPANTENTDKQDNTSQQTQQNDVFLRQRSAYMFPGGGAIFGNYGGNIPLYSAYEYSQMFAHNYIAEQSVPQDEINPQDEVFDEAQDAVYIDAQDDSYIELHNEAVGGELQGETSFPDETAEEMVYDVTEEDALAILTMMMEYFEPILNM